MTRVLVVDDNATNRRLVAALLAFEGYDLVEAVDGAEGLAKARETRPELVISDILMPTMDGYEFVRRLRNEPGLERTAVIFYTAHYHSLEARALAAQCGVHSVIIKPAESGVFIKAVKEALGGELPAAAVRTDDEFDVAHLRVLTDKLARTADQLRASNSRADALTELNVQLASERDPRTLLEKVCSGARDLLGAKFAVLAVAERGSSGVRHLLTSGIDADRVPPVLPDMANGLLGQVYQQHRTVRAAIAATEKLLPEGYPSCSAMLAVPVSSLTHNYGWLCLADKVGAGGFSADDERMARTIGAQVGRIYENGSLYAEVQSHAAYLSVEMEERERATAELRKSEERFRQLAENIQDVLFIISADLSQMHYVSPAYERIWGVPSLALFEDPFAWLESVHPKDVERARAAAQRIAAELPQNGEVEFRIVRPDGAVRWIHSRIFPIIGAHGVVQRAVGVSRDVTDEKVADERIKHLSRVHAMLSGINSLIVRATDRMDLLWAACRLAVEQGRFQIAWCGLLDPATGDVVPAAWAGDVPDGAKSTRLSIANGEGLVVSAMRAREPVICNDLRDDRVIAHNRKELVERGYRSVVALPLVIEGRAVGAVTLITDELDFFNDEEMRLLTELSGDISFALDHIEKGERLNYLAYYDALTGVANRTLFHERLAQYITAAARSGSQLGLIVADPIRFAAVNDSFGRTAGDQVLRELATRFAKCVGGAEFAGRIGSDQFAAVIPDIKSPTDVAGIVDTLLREWFAAPFELGGQRITLAGRVGVAVFPTDGRDADALLRNAETAWQNAKTTGKPQAFYAAHLSERVAEQLAMEKSIRRALDNEEFVLHYQPKVDLQDRRLRGVEALLRWQSPDLGLVPPAKFIPLLEETGLIVDVGAWALRQASVDRSQWIEQGLSAPRVAVNVSTVQLHRDDFVKTVSRVLRLAGSDAGLDIEVTESLLMTDVADNLAKLNALRQLGVGIALDDFGTGYSSLGYLARLPVQTLKIDRSFIGAMLDDPGAMTLVSTIISLALTLKLETVAEGVESEEQAKILRLLRCDQMQGYLISPPLSFDDMTMYLGRHR